MSLVFNKDCMDVMRNLPDNYYDLAIADPPYGISANCTPYKKNVRHPRRNRLKDGSGKLKDRVLQRLDSDFDFNPPDDVFFTELFRVSKNQIIWGGNYFSLPPTRGVICWDKVQPWLNFSQWEFAWTSFDCPAKIFRYRNTGRKGDEKIHPTQKPVALYEWLLKTYAHEGESIFDPMMGSQSSRIAALKLGFDYTGCEIDKKFFNEGNERYKKFRDKYLIL